jgi:inosine-uridine nucleoside N-ribohydrolase
MFPIIFDTDAGEDDVLALIYLVVSDEIDIKGVTIAGTGLANGPRGACNIASLCHGLGKNDLPIAYGRPEPLSAPSELFPPKMREDTDNLLDHMEIHFKIQPSEKYSAVELIKKLVSESKEKITILATGPLTNIADFINQYPNLINNIKRIVIMGGAMKVDGNIKALVHSSSNTVGEWNIALDPEAANIVFCSGVPVSLVPLDATNQVPMTKDFYNILSQEEQALHLRLIYQLLRHLHDSWGPNFFFKEFYFWDPLAAMICTQPDLAITEQFPIGVDPKTGQTNIEVGRPMIDVVMKIKHPESILYQFREKIIEFNARSVQQIRMH